MPDPNTWESDAMGWRLTTRLYNMGLVPFPTIWVLLFLEMTFFVFCYRTRTEITTTRVRLAGTSTCARAQPVDDLHFMMTSRKMRPSKPKSCVLWINHSTTFQKRNTETNCSTFQKWQRRSNHEKRLPESAHPTLTPS